MPKVLAINFHFVGNETSARFPGIHHRSEAEFVSQLDELQSRGDILHPNVLEQMISSGDFAPGYVLTFDDGLKDHAEFVRTELKRRNLAAFFFLNTAGWGSSPEVLDVHKLQLLNAGFEIDQLWNEGVSQLRASRPEFDSNSISVDDIRAVYTYDSIEVARFKYMLNLLATPEEKHRVVTGLFDKLLGDSNAAASDLYLTPEQVKEVVEDGHIVGGHTHRHQALSSMTQSERESDLTANKEAIDQALGYDSFSWFSYPFGDENSPDVRATCKEFGVKYSFTMRRGYVNDLEAADLIPRVDTNDAPGGKFARYE